MKNNIAEEQKLEKTESENDREAGLHSEKQGKLGPARILLGFLDHNLARFHPLVQNIIGLGILLLLVAYILHGFIAPTFVRGKLYIREKPEEGKQQVLGYTVEYRNECISTNLWGSWILPVYRSGIPERIRIKIYNLNKEYVDECSIFGPWPVWNALSPMEFDINIDMFKEQGRRIKVCHRRLGGGFISKMIPAIERLFNAYAQTFSVIVAAKEPEKQKKDKIATWWEMGYCGPRQEGPLDIGMEIRKINIKDFPGFLRDSGKVYFTVTLDGTPLDDKTLLYGQEQPKNPATVSWISSPETVGATLQPIRFPVKSISESWISSQAGKPEWYKGFVANVTNAVNFIKERDKTGEYVCKVKAKGEIQLKMWGDNDKLIGSFDISKAVETPNELLNLESPKAEVEIFITKGRIIDAAIGSPRRDE